MAKMVGKYGSIQHNGSVSKKIMCSKKIKGSKDNFYLEHIYKFPNNAHYYCAVISKEIFSVLEVFEDINTYGVKCILTTVYAQI